MSLHAFGAKIANVTGMTYDPDNENVKRLKARHPDNWQQIMAQSQGLSDATQAKVIKKAQSACSPCAMPNAPTNKKPYTSASPAVTDASQKSEEIGKPPVTETEHSAAKAKLPEEGAKSAFAFGAKVAESFGSSVANYGGPRNMLDSVIDTGVKGVNAVKAIPGKIWSAGESLANYGGPRNAMDSVIDAGVAAPAAIKSIPGRVGKSIWNAGESMANYGGPRNALDSVIDTAVAAPKNIASAIGGAIGRYESGKPSQAVNTPEAIEAVQSTAPATSGAGSSLGGILQMMRDNPGYTAAGGLGALGLGGLLYYLNSQPKKKKRDEEEV